MSIYFSKEDPIGTKSTVSNNFNNHDTRKTYLGPWGKGEHTRKLFPRGKAYYKLLRRQCDSIYKSN